MKISIVINPHGKFSQINPVYIWAELTEQLWQQMINEKYLKYGAVKVCEANNCKPIMEYGLK